MIHWIAELIELLLLLLSGNFLIAFSDANLVACMFDDTLSRILLLLLLLASFASYAIKGTGRLLIRLLLLLARLGLRVV